MSDEHGTPQLSDADLLAYLDGELEEERAKIIEQSAGLQQRLARLATEERRLAASLYRSSCPPPHELGEYHLEMLAAERASAVAQHIEICPHCALELQEMRETLRELAPDLELSFVERVRVLIARLVPDMPSFEAGPAPMPALAGIRGEMSGPLLYEAGDVQVSLEVQDDAAAGRKSVLGLVTGAVSEGWQATLWKEEGPVSQMLQTVAVDELGNFVFEGLQAGSFALTLRGDDVEIVVQDLPVS